MTLIAWVLVYALIIALMLVIGVPWYAYIFIVLVFVIVILLAFIFSIDLWSF